MNDTYLMHHGTKGQKWGVRRYQNADGSLTPEGRKRYGINLSNTGGMSDNTKERIRKGAKIGAIAGTGVGAGVTGLTIGQMVSTAAAAGLALNPVNAALIGGVVVASYAASGALRGALVGGIYGANETRQARKLMEQHPAKNTKLSDIKKK